MGDSGGRSEVGLGEGEWQREFASMRNELKKQRTMLDNELKQQRAMLDNMNRTLCSILSKMPYSAVVVSTGDPPTVSAPFILPQRRVESADEKLAVTAMLGFTSPVQK